MKNVLILAYEFPPFNSIGAHRPYSWFRYLHESGWRPTVVTRQWNEAASVDDLFRQKSKLTRTDEQTEHGRVVRIPYRLSLSERLYSGGKLFALPRRTLSLLHEVLDYIFPAFNRLRGFYNESVQLAKETKFDCVIATGSPFILFRHACDLSRRLGIPWLADYRDGWTTHPDFGCGQSGISGLLSKFHERAERKIIRKTQLITAAAPNYAKAISENIAEGRGVETILNGYDPEMVDRVNQSTEQNEKFTLLYAGTLYNFQRLETFLAGFRTFVANKSPDNVELVFVGTNFYPENTARIRNFDADLNPYIRITDRVPHAKAVEQMRAAHALVLLSGEESKQLPGKIFDYLAVERPVLLIENDKGPAESILNDFYPDLICESHDHVCRNLQTLFDAQHRTSSRTNDSTLIRTYSRQHQAHLLGNYLTQCLLKEERPCEAY